MKKLIASTIAFTLLVSPFTFSVSAQENTTITEEKNMDSTKLKEEIEANKLIKKTGKVKKSLTAEERKEIIDNFKYADSVSKDELYNLSDVSLQELNNTNGEIVSVEKVSSYALNSPREGEIVPFTMPTEHFEMTVIALQVGENVYQFHAEGDWKVNPNYEFTDVIALAWSDNFTLEDDLAYTLEDMGNDYLERDYIGLIRNDVDPEAGLGYDVDLVLGEDEEAVVLQAIVSAPEESGRANLVAEYGHLEISASDVTLGFSGGSSPSVTMEAGFNTNLEKASPAYDSFDY
ncbi:hypothetical protein [Rossellomorea aquimaris]|jgi:hypothetical protein|uniref:Uncharacterized protein n=1 Tax=Rossellomorea aquimaris TaxID=189382 RepID=A0A1J6WYT0_9BACI|nr:hypothetical protein [Rossellomorea aquimaris]OIU71065.1 hypothetical protein BHE18_08440 [Rossellomorea aquimaris]